MPPVVIPSALISSLIYLHQAEVATTLFKHLVSNHCREGANDMFRGGGLLGKKMVGVLGVDTEEEGAQ